MLLKFVGFMHPDFNFGWVLNDLKDNLKQELDFILEGKNAERCANDLKKLKYVYVPKIYWDLTSTVSSKLIRIYSNMFLIFN